MGLISFLKRQVPQSIQIKIQQAKAEKKFAEDYEAYKRTGTTEQEAYFSLIKLYCSTNGKFNESFHQKTRNENPAAKVTGPLQGVAGTFDTNDFNKLNKELNEDGYVKFEKKLPKEFYAKLYDYALTAKAKVPPKYDSKVVYDPANPVAEIYRFASEDIINNPDVQELIMDPVLINVARNYLQCEPILDFPAMWWSTAFSKEASSEAAQLYHFDMDRIKWLKIFFYLNDVDADNGPHCYIKGTHKIGAKPQNILNRGYVRVPDEELKEFHSPDKFIQLEAEAGTIFAGDTKCWHKGQPLKKGHRLVLEFEYTASLFGANYPKMVIENPSETFKQFCSNNKVYTSNIHLQ
jgi:hypothetical protein